jgi:hypothetical protein
MVALIEEADPKFLAIGFAVCDEQDEFDEKKGHMIAAGRALKAIDEMKGQFFRRPDVIGDFAVQGLNIRGIRKLPKSIFHLGPVSIKNLNKFRVLFSNTQVLKLLGFSPIATSIAKVKT